MYTASSNQSSGLSSYRSDLAGYRASGRASACYEVRSFWSARLGNRRRLPHGRKKMLLQAGFVCLPPECQGAGHQVYQHAPSPWRQAVTSDKSFARHRLAALVTLRVTLRFAARMLSWPLQPLPCCRLAETNCVLYLVSALNMTQDTAKCI